MTTDICYGSAELSHVELKRTLKNLKKFGEPHGLYVVVEDLGSRRTPHHPNHKQDYYNVELRGPRLRWKRVVKVIWEKE